MSVFGIFGVLALCGVGMKVVGLREDSIAKLNGSVKGFQDVLGFSEAVFTSVSQTL
jgi:hypothetical protein